MGELVSDAAEGLEVDWTAYHKVANVHYPSAGSGQAPGATGAQLQDWYNLSIDSSSLVTVIIDQQDTLQFRTRTGSKAVTVERESAKGYLIDIQNWDAAFK